MSRCYKWVGAVKDDLPGFTLDYFLCAVGYAASHRFPVHKCLTLHAYALDYRGNELDPLPIGEGVEEGVKLLRLGVLDVVVSRCA